MAHLTLLPDQGPVSPFDTIKQVRADGSEFWSARDLMPLLGYDKWERFSDAIERGRAAITNSGMSPDDHLPGAGKMVMIGSRAQRRVADFHMTRYGAYVVTMNGDPRKTEIAQAQTYFAVRTHEAEQSAMHKAPDLDLSDTGNLVGFFRLALETAERLDRATKDLATAQAQIEAQRPMVQRSITRVASTTDVTRQMFAREVQAWAATKGIKVLHKDVYRFLATRLDLFIMDDRRRDYSQATASGIKRGFSHTKFSEVQHKNDIQTHGTGLLTAKGQEYAWERITRVIEQDGTL